MCAPLSELLTNRINMVSLAVEIAESPEVTNREPGTDTTSHIRSREIPYLYVRLCLAPNIYSFRLFIVGLDKGVRFGLSLSHFLASDTNQQRIFKEYCSKKWYRVM